MTTTQYLLFLSPLLATILAVFGMKYASAAIAARARLANDEAYRSLAEKAAAAQAENQSSLSAIQAELSKVVASLAAVETILKQVG